MKPRFHFLGAGLFLAMMNVDIKFEMGYRRADLIQHDTIGP